MLHNERFQPTLVPRAAEPRRLDSSLVQHIGHRVTFLFMLLVTSLAGCGRAEYSAEFKMPESDFILRLELKQVNFPLAEYERSLVIVRAGFPLLRVDLG